jgi:hypothetical protein
MLMRNAIGDVGSEDKAKNNAKIQNNVYRIEVGPK